jgi:hypothetical protein
MWRAVTLSAVVGLAASQSFQIPGPPCLVYVYPNLIGLSAIVSVQTNDNLSLREGTVPLRRRAGRLQSHHRTPSRKASAWTFIYRFFGG